MGKRAAYMKEKKHIQSVERAMSLLTYIADHGSARLGAISEYAGLKTSTTFGLLQTLEYLGLIARSRNGMEYCLGLNSLKLGLSFNQNSGMPVMIHTLLKELVKEVDETAYFEIKIGNRYYYYDVVVSDLPLKVVPGNDQFIDLPENSAVARAYSGLPEGMKYAADLEEVEQGLNCFAVPFYSGSVLSGVVAMTGPSYRFTREKMDQAYEAYCRIRGSLISEEE